METKEYLQELVANARAAQQAFARLSQEDVDKAVKAIGKAGESGGGRDPDGSD